MKYEQKKECQFLKSRNKRFSRLLNWRNTIFSLTFFGLSFAFIYYRLIWTNLSKHQMARIKYFFSGSTHTVVYIEELIFKDCKPLFMESKIIIIRYQNLKFSKDLTLKLLSLISKRRKIVHNIIFFLLHLCVVSKVVIWFS